jgi:hypothetical protein
MVLAVTAVALAVHAGVASAGTYRVYSCVAPSGGAAPSATATTAGSRVPGRRRDRSPWSTAARPDRG